jgi:hypothetical protein
VKHTAPGREKLPDAPKSLFMSEKRLSDVATDLRPREGVTHKLFELEAALGQHSEKVVSLELRGQPIGSVRQSDRAVIATDEVRLREMGSAARHDGSSITHQGQADGVPSKGRDIDAPG